MVTSTREPSACERISPRTLARVTVLPSTPRAAVTPSATTRFGTDQGSLLIEPPAATIDFVSVRALVQAALATFLEFEVLDGIGDENPDPIEAGVTNRAVENATCRPDERAAAQILFVARLFPDEHDASIERPLSGNNLSGMQIRGQRVQLASALRSSSRFDAG
jgi:hypothetical protein